jgi:hypothetical protein
MIVYNVTVKVEHTIAPGWLTWLREEHIPAIINTGCFTHAAIFHLWEADDEEGVTYAVQYHAKDEASYHLYIEKFSGEMRKKAIDKWGHQTIAFRTVMRVVN